MRGQHRGRSTFLSSGQCDDRATHTCTTGAGPNREPVDVAWLTHSRALATNASTWATAAAESGCRPCVVDSLQEGRAWGTTTSSSHLSPCGGHVRRPQRNAGDRRGRGREGGRASVNLKTATSGSSSEAWTRSSGPRLTRALLLKRKVRLKQLAVRVTLACRLPQPDSDERHQAPAGAAGASMATRMSQAWVLLCSRGAGQIGHACGGRSGPF
jgi:hypothetical protein